jgi:glycosyltransferase involved in cell wall biosynthesis
MERRFFLRAARIVLNTDSARDAYRARYAGVIPSERFTTIRNSFDPALYGPAPESPGQAGPFEIVYFGHLRPAKNAILFLEGFRRFIEAEGLRPGEAMLTTLGTRTAGDEEAIARLGLAGHTRTHPWVPVTEARAFLGRADLLLDLMGSDHVLQVSGKLYDYLACGRPILAVTPNEETGRILGETGAGTRVALDAGAIAAALGRQLAAKRAGERFAPDPEGLGRYQAGPAARRLADILEDVTR